MQPKHPSPDFAARICGGYGQRQDVAALHEQLAVKRDADGLAGARMVWRLRFIEDRPSFDRPYHRNFCARRNPDLVTDGDATAFDAPGDDAAVVELVYRLN